jgi:hypothetical protein
MKRSFDDFAGEALKGNGVQNDSKDAWVVVDGEQYTVSVESILEREEQEPFEVSYTLEADLEHFAWKNNIFIR